MGSDVKIDLISGFCGAGKTTLLCQMASRLWLDERVVLLQNEQGRAKLSPEILPDHCFPEEWRGGCLCCTASTSMEPLILDLLGKYHPNRIVFELAETSRIADVRAALESMGEGSFQLEHIIYVLNAEMFDRKWELSEAFIVRQLGESPAVWLTNAESAGEDLRARISEAVRESSPRCSVVCSDRGVAELYRRSRIYKKIRFASRL